MNEKTLTDLVRIWGDLAGSTGEDGLQRLGTFTAVPKSDTGSACVDKAGGRGCRAEEAKSEGGEDGEDERAHYERLMSVWG